MDNVHPKLRPTTLDFSEGAVCWGLCPFLIGHLPNHVDELGWFPTNHSTRGITSGGIMTQPRNPDSGEAVSE